MEFTWLNLLESTRRTEWVRPACNEKYSHFTVWKQTISAFEPEPTPNTINTWGTHSHPSCEWKEASEREQESKRKRTRAIKMSSQCNADIVVRFASAMPWFITFHGCKINFMFVSGVMQYRHMYNHDCILLLLAYRCECNGLPKWIHIRYSPQVSPCAEPISIPINKIYVFLIIFTLCFY